MRAGRSRLADRARELRGRVRRRRRSRPPRPFARGGDRRLDDDPRRRRAHHALRIPPGAVAAAQAPHRRHQEQRAALRDGDVGRDRGAGRTRVRRRRVGQGARRRGDGANGQPARVARHDRRDEPARRHPERSRRRACRQPRHRADRQHQPRAPPSVDVRADPRLGLRHHGAGDRESGRHLLVGRADARAPGRGRSGAQAHAHDRGRHRRPVAVHPRPRRHGDDRAGDRRGLRPSGGAGRPRGRQSRAQYVSRSGRTSRRIVVAISSIDLCVDDSHAMPSRFIIVSPSRTS